MEIHRFRNVAPGTKIRFHPQLNVLLGRNGTGKTTLLRWLADALSGAMHGWAGEPYDVTLELESNTAKTRVRLKNEPLAIREQLSRHMGRGELDMAEWAFERSRAGGAEMVVEIADPRGPLVFHTTPSEATLSLAGTQLIATDQWRGQSGFLDLLGIFGFAVEKEDSGPRLRDAREIARGVMHDVRASYRNLCRFDESLDFFSRMVNSEASGEHDKTLGLSIWKFNGDFVAGGLMPRELVRRLEESWGRTRENVSSFSFSSDEIEFLDKVVDLFGYSAAIIEISVLGKDVFGKQGVELCQMGGARFMFERPDGSSFSHDQLSYGQKRALAFLYYLAANPQLIIVDELVNGLHHAWIEACREEIGGRQALLTSQNPLLLDHLPLSSPEDVRQCFILCSSRSSDDQEQLVWRNPTEEEADSFFSAYQAGIQHVGEILMDKGMW